MEQPYFSIQSAALWGLSFKFERLRCNIQEFCRSRREKLCTQHKAHIWAWMQLTSLDASKILYVLMAMPATRAVRERNPRISTDSSSNFIRVLMGCSCSSTMSKTVHLSCANDAVSWAFKTPLFSSTNPSGISVKVYIQQYFFYPVLMRAKETYSWYLHGRLSKGFIYVQVRRKSRTRFKQSTVVRPSTCPGDWWLPFSWRMGSLEEDIICCQ